MKDVKGYEGLYAVTSCGRVWSYKSKKFLSPGDNGKGYLQVCLCNDGKQKIFYVHRLVAEAYLENPNGYTEINHKDENKKNNAVTNLEWCSRKYNCNYGSRNKKKVIGISCSEPESTKIEGVSFNSITEAAAALNIAVSGISACLHKRRSSAGGYAWFFLEEKDERISNNAD